MTSSNTGFTNNGSTADPIKQPYTWAAENNCQVADLQDNSGLRLVDYTDGPSHSIIAGSISGNYRQIYATPADMLWVTEPKAISSHQQAAREFIATGM